MPCTVCSKHWVQVFDEMRAEFIDMCKTRDSAFQMMYDIHNVWNLCLGKPFVSWNTVLVMYGLNIHTPYESTPLMHVLNRSVSESLPLVECSHIHRTNGQ